MMSPTRLFQRDYCGGIESFSTIHSNSVPDASSVREETKSACSRGPERDRALKFILGAVSLSIVLTFCGRQLGQGAPWLWAMGESLQVLSVVLFACAVLWVIWPVPNIPHVRWTLLTGLIGLVLTEVLNLTGHVALLADVPMIGGNSLFRDWAEDLTFLGGFGMMVIGFCAGLFELSAAKSGLEAEREELRREVRERAQVEAALRENRERYGLVFHGTSDGILLLTPDLRVLQFNRGLSQMAGYTAGELNRLQPLDLVHPEDRARVRLNLRLHLAEEKADRTIEFRIVHRTGKVLHVAASFDLIRQDDRVICVQLILRDVTETKNAEAALRHQLRRESLVRETSTRFISNSAAETDLNIRLALRDLAEFKNADRACVVELDPLTGALHKVHEWRRADVAAAEFPSRKVELLDCFPGLRLNGEGGACCAVPRVWAMPEASAGQRDRLIAQGIRSLYAVPMRCRGDVTGILAIEYHHSEKSIGEDGLALVKLVGEILAMAIERRRSELALAASEEKYRAIIGNIVEGYYEVDIDGSFTFFNEPVSSILGYAPDDLLGMNYRAYYAPEVADRIQSAFRAVLKTGEPVKSLEAEVIRKDGAARFIEISGTLIRDEHSKPTGFRGIIRDITERRQAEAERRRIEREMQQTQRLESLGVLAGGIAHDFNNLLMGVLAHAGLAAEELPDDSPAREAIKHIELSAQRAADLANQLLTYSGRGHFNVRPADLSSLVEEMLDLLKASISKKAQLVLECAQGLPLIEGDVTQIRQVAMNLITNASEALGDGPGLITLRTGTLYATAEFLQSACVEGELEEGEYVCLEVSDTGCGMSPETIQRIFEPFFTTKFTGRGLGLAAVRGIVKAHGGGIIITSAPGAGTSFTVLFPSTGLPSDPVETEEREVETVRGQGTVLVIDDEPIVRDVAERILSRAGFKVLTARDGLEGVQIYDIHRDKIDLVLLDLTMPHMDGLETFEELMKRDERVRVILSSGYKSAGETGLGPAVSPHGFIQKPYRGRDLVKLCCEVLALS